MVVRTARSGPSAGAQFWGCTRYPECRGTRPYVEASNGERAQTPASSQMRPREQNRPFGEAGGARRGATDDSLLDEPLDDQDDVDPEDLPHEVELEPLRPNLQVRLFQAVGLPREWVERIHDASVPPRLRRAAAQWRLDWPLRSSPDTVSRFASVISVVEKILTRGALTIVDPQVEEALPVPDRETISSEDIRKTVELLAADPTIPPSWPLHTEVWGKAKPFAEWFDNGGFGRLGWTLVPGMTLKTTFQEAGERTSHHLPIVLAHPSVERLTAVTLPGDGSAAAPTTSAWAQWREMEVFPLRPGTDYHGPDPALDHLATLLARASVPRSTLPVVHLRLSRFAHQVQIALLEAFRVGLLPDDAPWKVAIQPPERLVRELEPAELELVLARAVEGFAELLVRVASLHGVPLGRPEVSTAVLPSSPAGPAQVLIRAGFSGRVPVLTGAAEFVIHDLPLGLNVAPPVTAAPPVRRQNPQREDAEWMLNYVFRKPSFWEGQWETVRRTLEGKDTLVLLPTGAGKSIAFQLGAICLPGMCIAVAPIVSLVEDQLDNLDRVGIDRAVGITSNISDRQQREAAVTAVGRGWYLYCYVAPERFQIASFRDALRQATATVPVCSVAIDEAHCVSEWGHDFRTAYLNLGRIARDYCKYGDFVPPLIGLTGTASYIVLRDVQRQLGILDYDALVTPTSFDRRELSFHIMTCRSEEKTDRLIGIMNSLPSRFGLASNGFFRPRGGSTASGLVFCPHVRGKFGIFSFQKAIDTKLQVSSDVYAGGLSKPKKRLSAHRFKRNEVPVLVCTKAFGMGIDKPNIRYTIHTGLPASIESYYQEAGRAGRDRQRALSFIVLSDDRPQANRQLLDPNTDVTTVAKRIAERQRDGTEDDVTRALWFHVQAFRGKERDLEVTKATLGLLGETGQARDVVIGWRMPRGPGGQGLMQQPGRGQDDDETQKAIEKALHRLVVIGVVADYTVDYVRREFHVRLADTGYEDVREHLLAYIGDYQAGLVPAYEARVNALMGRRWRDYLVDVCSLLIDFIYEHIERARRRSLREMLEAASLGDGERLRERILNYLTTTEYDDFLVGIIQSTTVADAMQHAEELLDVVVSPNDAERIRGAVARYLTSYPDVPVLLALRAVTEGLSRDPDREDIRQNLTAAMNFARDRYGYTPDELVGLAGLAIRAMGRRPEVARDAALDLVAAMQGDVSFLRGLARAVPAFAAVPYAMLSTRLLVERIDRVLGV